MAWRLARWFKRLRDWSTKHGPICLSACSFACTAPSFACSALLASLARSLRSFVRPLAHSLWSSWEGVFFSMEFHTVSTQSAGMGRVFSSGNFEKKNADTRTFSEMLGCPQSEFLKKRSMKISPVNKNRISRFWHLEIHFQPCDERVYILSMTCLSTLITNCCISIFPFHLQM